jgi:hypothetical protein
MGRSRQRAQGCCNEQRADRRDFGSAAYVMYIAGRWVDSENTIHSFVFSKDFTR